MGRRAALTKTLCLSLSLSIYLTFSLSLRFLPSYLSYEVKYKLDESTGLAATSNYKTDEVAFKNPQAFIQRSQKANFNKGSSSV